MKWPFNNAQFIETSLYCAVVFCVNITRKLFGIWMVWSVLFVSQQGGCSKFRTIFMVIWRFVLMHVFTFWFPFTTRQGLTQLIVVLVQISQLVLPRQNSAIDSSISGVLYLNVQTNYDLMYTLQVVIFCFLKIKTADKEGLQRKWALAEVGWVEEDSINPSAVIIPAIERKFGIIHSPPKVL